MTATAHVSTNAGIEGGSPTIYITNMDRAVDFYTNALGLKLQTRAADHFAMVDAGQGFRLGLHPQTEKAPAPGVNGATQVGLNVTRRLDDVVKSLQARGVQFRDMGSGPIFDDGFVRLAFFNDPDGNALYLCEYPARQPDK